MDSDDGNTNAQTADVSSSLKVHTRFVSNGAPILAYRQLRPRARDLLLTRPYQTPPNSLERFFTW